MTPLDRTLTRAENLKLITGKDQRLSLMMDLTSQPYNLEQLNDFPNFDFTHDICGIIRHTDRSNWPGKLMDCFVPRCGFLNQETTA